MKITYYLLTDRWHQKELHQGIRHLFEVEPTLVVEKGRTAGRSPGRFASVVEFMQSRMRPRCQLVFTLGSSERELGREQQDFLGDHRGLILKEEYRTS